MPFTLSHTVVALPLRGRRWWSAPAVAAGSMAPDLPLFVPGVVPYDATHSSWAVPTLDVLLGAAMLAAWWAVVRPGLLAIAPAVVRSRATRSESRARR